MQNAAAKKILASSHKVEDDEVRDEKFNKLTRILQDNRSDVKRMSLPELH